MTNKSNFLSIHVLFLAILMLGNFSYSEASTTDGTISSTYYTAQVCENLGCTVTSTSPVNFGYFANSPSTGTSSYLAHVTDSALSGFAWGKSFGWVVLNCVNTSSGCSSANGNFKVANDSNGNLSGYAWGQNAGWINFGPFANSPTQSVIINSEGQFSGSMSGCTIPGYAWSENFGWIKFDCSNENYKVQTDWRPYYVRPPKTSSCTNPLGCPPPPPPPPPPTDPIKNPDPIKPPITDPIKPTFPPIPKITIPAITVPSIPKTSTTVDEKTINQTESPVSSLVQSWKNKIGTILYIPQPYNIFALILSLIIFILVHTWWKPRP